MHTLDKMTIALASFSDRQFSERASPEEMLRRAAIQAASAALAALRPGHGRCRSQQGAWQYSHVAANSFLRVQVHVQRR